MSDQSYSLTLLTFFSVFLGSYGGLSASLTHTRALARRRRPFGSLGILGRVRDMFEKNPT